MNIQDYTIEAVELLKRLIATPSISRDEKAAADEMGRFLTENGLSYQREGNNIWMLSPDFSLLKPTLLLNAHIDTVKPAKSWSRDPFKPTIEGDRLYGLGSNDCGGGLVSLLQVYRILASNSVNAKYNYVYLASCEEEISGENGFSRVLPLLPKIDVAIVGEPTGMQPAVAEKGLMVLDLIATGKSGHAAREEGINAIYAALDDLNWIRNYRFERISDFLGATKMQVTVINAGTQHNVVPDECNMLIDVRTNELYSNQEVFDIINQNTKCKLVAHSLRLSSSHIPLDHPLVKRCMDMGMKPFGSPTLSDQALMPFPSLKLGPGESSRSHSADEYICISEIENAIRTYTEILR